jgi:hypothetical protein
MRGTVAPAKDQIRLVAVEPPEMKAAWWSLLQSSSHLIGLNDFHELHAEKRRLTQEPARSCAYPTVVFRPICRKSAKMIQGRKNPPAHIISPSMCAHCGAFRTSFIR